MVFKFKEFSVDHERSSMKVGTDAILLGAWAEMPQEPEARVLDVGCGCGLIALMAAQRLDVGPGSPFEIQAIDIDEPSVEEAACNFAASPWSDRLHACKMDFRELSARAGEQGSPRFHLIISNPPFFTEGLKCPAPARNLARHNDTLSFEELLSGAEKLLYENGSLALILPPSAFGKISEIMPQAAPSLHLLRLTEVYAKAGKACERILGQWRKGTGTGIGTGTGTRTGGPRAIGSTDLRSLYIRDSQGRYTPPYLTLVRDFYQNL